MLLDTLRDDLSTSLKHGDANRVETLRFLLAAIRNTAIAKYGSAGEAALTDTDILDVVKRQVKTHKESIDAFANAGRKELVEKEQGQLKVLQAFLPKEMSDEDLKKLMEPIASSGETNFGLLMKQAMALIGGKADGGRVAGILKEIIHLRQDDNKTIRQEDDKIS